MILESGRNFTAEEIQMTRHFVLIGADIVKDLFPSGVDPLGKEITVAGLKLKIIGVLKSKGASVVKWRQGLFYACNYCKAILFTSEYDLHNCYYAYKSGKPRYDDRRGRGNVQNYTES